MSHCHHHWHPIDPHTKMRAPIRGCLAKHSGKCKAQFPMTKRLNLQPKIICAGNCRRHDLRVAGRRNALGSILNKRQDEWLSGTAAAFAVIFRHNTHTAPNYRVPIITATHDKDCKANCLQQHTLRRMISSAQRAQRNTTGYYCGYIQKRQPIGKFELKQAALNLQFLKNSISHRSNAQQYHHAANRMLGDLEYRGHVRPATEEFNLASNYCETDVTNAEFIRTFQTADFYGGNLIRRATKTKKPEEETQDVRSCRIPCTFPTARQKAHVNMSFEDTYGYRGPDPRVFYRGAYRLKFPISRTNKSVSRNPLDQGERSLSS
jgi:hypothetical protein